RSAVPVDMGVRIVKDQRDGHSEVLFRYVALFLNPCEYEYTLGLERAAHIYFAFYIANIAFCQLNPGSNAIGLAKHDVATSCNRESVDLSNGLTFGINIDAITDDAFLYFI